MPFTNVTNNVEAQTVFANAAAGAGLGEPAGGLNKDDHALWVIAETVQGLALRPVLAQLYRLFPIYAAQGGVSWVDSVAVTPSTISPALAGTTLQLSAKSYDVLGNEITGRSYTWTTSNDVLATVSASGLVSFLENGVVTITAHDASAVTGTFSALVTGSVTPWYNVAKLSSARVDYGGVTSASMASNSAVSGGTTTGRTYVSNVTTEMIRQHGTIRQVTYWGTNTTGQFKFMILRPNGANYDIIAKSEAFTPVAGMNTRTLTTPMTGAKVGDYLGVYITGTTSGGSGSMQVKTSTGNSMFFVAGEPADGATAVTFGTAVADFTMNVCPLGTPPALAVSGDSINAGHNTPSWFPPYFEAGTGDQNGAPVFRMRLNEGVDLQYQNFAKGSQTFAWVNSTGMPAAVLSQGTDFWIHCGVNDVAAARTWAAVLSDLNAIRAQTTQPIFFDEILPWPAGTDADALTIRTWNANLAAWVAAQAMPTYLVLCHDAFAQIRPSTGQLDDMQAIYAKGDGVHLSQAGVDKLAQLAYAKITAALA